MGLGTESATLVQLKKAQGETNQRLDAIAALLRELLDKTPDAQNPPDRSQGEVRS